MYVSTLGNENTCKIPVNKYEVSFISKVFQSMLPRDTLRSYSQTSSMSNKFNALSQKGTIQEYQEVEGKVISYIFLVFKPNGFHRLILNLKWLNKFVRLANFNFEDHKTAKRLIISLCSIAKKDIQNNATL